MSKKDDLIYAKHLLYIIDRDFIRITIFNLALGLIFYFLGGSFINSNPQKIEYVFNLPFHLIIGYLFRFFGSLLILFTFWHYFYREHEK